MVSVAAIVATDRGTIRGARVAFGGVAHKPWRSIEAEAALAGRCRRGCGANAAVANAVFNATGVRVRDFPITVEKVLPGLPLPAAITSE
jgi:xanthine dehydrogenase YagS FAD-binding subunit